MPFAEAHVAIDAPIELVWSVILAFDEYPAWNPSLHWFQSSKLRSCRATSA